MTVQALKTQPETTDSFVSCLSSQGVELQAALLKLTRFQTTFEIYSPSAVLRTSELLKEVKIVIQGKLVYSGQAVVSNLVHFGAVLVCEASLDEACLNISSLDLVNDASKLQAAFDGFITDCGKNFKVYPEFKVTMADMQIFFAELRLWMEQMELAVRSQPVGDRSHMERQLLYELHTRVLAAAAPVLERFEAIASKVDTDLQPAHRAYMKRQIHPVVLCSPFLYRTFRKPLGYAGDYEMVNMMVRDPYEGGSMFAKMVNRVFLNTPPVVAHQNRITYLKRHLQSEAKRVAVRGKRLRVFNVGCGPAKELQDFLAEDELSNCGDFTLLDFNEETLAYTTKVLSQIKSKHQRITSLQMVKKSVHLLLKEAGKPGKAAKYDLVYCAGLFDYLSDQVCKRLVAFLYDMVVPGGLLITTNVSTSNPSRNWMEYVLDWHLIYRNALQFVALAPETAPAGSFSVQAIGDGVNISLEVRKPENAS